MCTCIPSGWPAPSKRWFAAHGWVAGHSFEPAAVADTLRAHNVRRFCFFSYAHRPGMSRELNRWLAATAAALPDAIALGTLHPDDPDLDAIATEATGDLGLRGFKFHHSVQKFHVDDPRLFGVYERAEAAGHVFMLHVGTLPYRDEFTGVERFRHVMARFPRLRVCVAHMGAFQSAEFLALLPQYPHLYVDTTMAMTALRHAATPGPIPPRSATPTSCVTRIACCSDRTSHSSPTTTTWSGGGRGSAASATTCAGRSSTTMRSASSRSTELTLARLGPAAAALLRVVQRVGRGEGTVLVGGAVRDALLGRPVADLDVAVPAGALALAERVATALGATAVVLDAERGAARVAGPGLQLDFSDFRAPRSRRLTWPPATSPSTRSACPSPPCWRLAGRGIVDPTGGRADLRARRLRPAGARCPGRRSAARAPRRTPRSHARAQADAGRGARRSGRGARADARRRRARARRARGAAGRARGRARAPARATGSACWRWCCPRWRRCARAPAGAASLRRPRALAAGGRGRRRLLGQLDALEPFGDRAGRARGGGASAAGSPRAKR